jgi:hypothetical protein
LPTGCSKNNLNGYSEVTIPDFIHIYKDESNLDWKELFGYIHDRVGDLPKIDIRDRFMQFQIGKDVEHIAKELVRTKVFDVSDPSKVYDPFPVEIQHEMELMGDPKKKFFGNLYDGFKLQKIFRELLPPSESDLKHQHIVFTNRSIATWDRGDGRYHARTSVYGFPSIISLSGLVEAPAKPREFYVLRKALVSGGMARELVEEELKSKFKDRFIDYGDLRMTAIVKGYLMQALFYHIMFEPFCDHKNCRLFNAHWQEDMIHAQLGEPEFCERHEGILKGLRNIK